jgi:hypothetical protein
MKLSQNPRRSHSFYSIHAFCLFGCMAVLSAAPQSQEQKPSATDGAFDAPIKKRVAYFGRSPYYRNASERGKLYCYFYPTLLVNACDEGQKGAEWLSFVRLEEGTQDDANWHMTPGEHVVVPLAAASPPAIPHSFASSVLRGRPLSSSAIINLSPAPN